MYQYRRPSLTLFDALPKIKAKDLRPGDLLMHRGRAGYDEGAALPVLHVELAEEARIRIAQPITPSHLFPDGESVLGARAEELVTLAPPYWPHRETQTITSEDVAAARAHVGDRAVR
jgi:hypothetical protein